MGKAKLPAGVHLLDERDFPFTIWAVREDTGEWGWGVTLLAPPSRMVVPLRIPPVASWYGCPVYIVTQTGGGYITTSPAMRSDMWWDPGNATF